MKMPEQKTMSVKVQEQPVERLPYRLRESFMSTPELALLRALQEMIGRHYVICPKVSLNDIFYIVRPNENVHFFNKIFRKHVDFLLCDPNTLKPAIGVELVKPAELAQFGPKHAVILREPARIVSLHIDDMAVLNAH